MADADYDEFGTFGVHPGQRPAATLRGPQGQTWVRGAGALTSVALIVGLGVWDQVIDMSLDDFNRSILLNLTSFFLPLVPAMWILSHNPVYLVMAQVIAGFFWAGFNIASSNFVYDAVTPEKRTRCIAYFNVINGLSIMLAAATGGLLLKVLPPVFGSKVMPLFFISAAGRLAVAAFLGNFKEVRQVKHVSHSDLLYSIIGLRPLLSTLSRSE